LSFGWLDIPAFLLAVCVLVTVHEFGHFWVARKLGFKVLRFSVGFGRPLWKRTAGPDQTEYVLAAVPLGGYIKMLDEREGAVPEADLHRAFTRRPHWQRIAVLLAGPAANFIFAILLLTGMFWVSGLTEMRPLVGAVTPGQYAERAGLHSGDELLAVNGAALRSADGVVLALLDAVGSERAITMQVRGANGTSRELRFSVDSSAERRRLSNPDSLLQGLGFSFQTPVIPAVLGTVVPGGPAAQAGLRAGDRVLEVEGVRVHDFTTLAAQLRARPGETVKLLVRRDSGEQLLSVQVASELDNGKTVGRIQVRPQPVNDSNLFRHSDVGPIAALSLASVRAWELTALQGRLMWRMVFGQVSVKNLSGPLTIAQMAGESARAGGATFLSYLVLISLALGFMNLLPIPILDGGQVVMQVFEWVKGSALSERAQVLGQQAGIMLVMLLLGLALFNDIARQFG
jgi:regulator of sigma E protease